MTLYELPRHTLQNIPEVLRAIAQNIEDNVYGEIEMAAIVIKNSEDSIKTFGLGGADYYRAIALFHIGINYMLNNHEEDEDDSNV